MAPSLCKYNFPHYLYDDVEDAPRLVCPADHPGGEVAPGFVGSGQGEVVSVSTEPAFASVVFVGYLWGKKGFWLSTQSMFTVIHVTVSYMFTVYFKSWYLLSKPELFVCQKNIQRHCWYC